jgi:hypothetical protein
MSDLQDALDWWDGHNHNDPRNSEYMGLFIEAARLVANPNVRVFIRKHPEDGLPYIDEMEPRSAATLEAPDYSGWYIPVDAALTPGDIG